jgi:hypothetical protein
MRGSRSLWPKRVEFSCRGRPSATDVIRPGLGGPGQLQRLVERRPQPAYGNSTTATPETGADCNAGPALSQAPRPAKRWVRLGKRPAAPPWTPARAAARADSHRNWGLTGGGVRTANAPGCC